MGSQVVTLDSVFPYAAKILDKIRNGGSTEILLRCFGVRISAYVMTRVIIFTIARRFLPRERRLKAIALPELLLKMLV